MTECVIENKSGKFEVMVFESSFVVLLVCLGWPSKNEAGITYEDTNSLMKMDTHLVSYKNVCELLILQMGQNASVI